MFKQLKPCWTDTACCKRTLLGQKGHLIFRRHSILIMRLANWHSALDEEKAPVINSLVRARVLVWAPISWATQSYWLFKDVTQSHYRLSRQGTTKQTTVRIQLKDKQIRTNMWQCVTPPIIVSQYSDFLIWSYLAQKLMFTSTYDINLWTAVHAYNIQYIVSVIK